jgi:hypothetical protein
MKIPTWLSLFLLFVVSSAVAAEEQKVSDMPIFDAHIHYSHDVWDAIPPEDAIRRLLEVGVERALVSSSSDEGTQKLYQADPTFVVPSLRPYRERGMIGTWMYDETLIPYLKEHLEKYRYAAIGEFHINGEQARTPVMREVINMAKQYQLILHVHSDAKAVRLIFEQYPEARILWAHAGFEQADTVSKLMDEQPELMADLSFRTEIYQNGQFFPGWEQLLVRHGDRFLLGIDTYEPVRWLQIDNVMMWQRSLLAALPADAARKIAYDNSEWITRRFDK